jgi:protein involved in polysaccharide export with SLBB domain
MALIPVCHVPEYSWWTTVKEFFGFKEEKSGQELSKKCPPTSSNRTDSYAVVGSFQMTHNWFGPLIIRQFIATGMAARHLVSTPTVHVIGEVMVPGRHPFTKGLMVKQAIDLAGGRTDQASPEVADILRHTNGHQEKLEGKPETLLLPDDILNIVKAQWFHISGEVKTPGRYLHEEGMRIEKALSLAGGRTDKDEKGKIKATQVKKDDRTAETRELGAKAPILPDDIIVVELPLVNEDQAKKQKPDSQGTGQEKKANSKPKPENTDAGKSP